ncbi:MAG: RNA polymerase sigma factor [Oscillospiraceae bacterium]|nr:RNA polymerase sigma factor [Oscillospiraceae bacterium]MBR2889933.1 RNA polymerase sigma factor [Oscillospiraceae bacterium]
MTDAESLFHTYKDDVYRFALSYTRSREEAEDICQTVFEKLLRQKTITPGKEKAWLMQTCANACRNLLRCHWWQRTAPLDSASALEAEEEHPVKQAIHSLAPHYRAVVYLYYYEGYSTQEIASLLHISQTLVSTRLHRARQTLKQLLEE